MGALLFDELRKELEAYLSPEAVEKIYSAYRLASEAHLGQQRKTGDPFISHPIAVATILASMRMDYQSIMAAILHDVLEDSSVDKKTLTKKFGQDVAELVDGVSKLTKIKFETQAEAQAENFRKMLLAMTKDIRVIIIKLADRLHNMRTLQALPPEKRRRIAIETLEIYAPIANRLGMHNIRIEFEDLGFAALYPMRYRIFKTAVEKARGHRKEIINEIKNAIKKCLEAHGIPASAVVGRQKHLYGIYKKMRVKHLSFNEIMDVYAFRIIVKDIDLCYRALGVAHSLYKPLFERFKDYIAIPKANGYQSLHTTLFGPYGVPIEIQIRTAEMDYLADNGIAAHWLYKSVGSEITYAEVRAREWLKGLLDLHTGTVNSLEFIENVKIDLFPDETYVFTPKGNILELPAGATPIDFAYAIHSDIGNSCVAVKINRRLAPLSTPLVNGQTIEIITAPGACPNPAWLNFVVTGKAQSSIRYFIKNRKRAESIIFGKQLIAQALASLGSSWEKLTRKNVNAVLKSLQYKTIDDLCEAAGLGQQLPLVIAHRLVGEIKTKNEFIPLIIKGTEGMVVNFGKCCGPIPGDPIVGYLESGKGMTIHLEDCKKITAFADRADKCVPVRWEENIPGKFTTMIHVEVLNQPGTLAQVTAVIAEMQANIEDIELIPGDRGYSDMQIALSVRDRSHLAEVFRRIRALKITTKLFRTNA